METAQIAPPPTSKADEDSAKEYTVCRVQARIQEVLQYEFIKTKAPYPSVRIERQRMG
jgi:hypothetical protein